MYRLDAGTRNCNSVLVVTMRTLIQVHPRGQAAQFGLVQSGLARPATSIHCHPKTSVPRRGAWWQR